ncbi:MAG TPA: outer membrane beta-barrel protein, partial [Stellaceae bacterium]|nr:outer membrane beta-barrel protein [Stellaceae bacterium]
IDLTGVTYVDAYVGYLDQLYDSTLLGSLSGVDFGANAVWNVTELTSVSFNVSRNVQDAPTSVVGAASVPGYFHTVVGARVDHELLRNLLLNGQVTYANDDFQGENRTDSDYLATVGAKYLLNRNLYLGANYTFEHRDSSGTQAINQFNRNIFMLRASTQF